jgi:hypothetical protein
MGEAMTLVAAKQTMEISKRIAGFLFSFFLFIVTTVGVKSQGIYVKNEWVVVCD